MKKQIILCSICLALVGMMGCNPTSDSIQVSHLQVEMKDNPQGIDVEHPRFSWLEKMLSELDRKEICATKFKIVNSPTSPFFFLIEKK